MAQQQNNRQGGGGRQMQREPQERSQNQQITYAQHIGQRVNEIIRAVEQQRAVIEAVMPEHVTFEQVRSNLLIMLRMKPEIVECTTSSIVMCAMKGAYDGVNLDNVEAAAIPSNNKTKHPVSGKDVWLLEARYQIMVAGVRKQIMASGAVQDPPETILIHKGDEFRQWVEDGVRKISHEIGLDTGEMVGVYSMARLPSGNVSYEVMSKKQMDDLRDFAKQKGTVWESKMEPEMWRKSVLRRHKKTLLGGRSRPDAEEIDMFPGNAANVAALPAAQRERPRRENYRLSDQSDTTGGVDLGFDMADKHMVETFDKVGEVAEKEQRQQQRREVDQNSGADRKTSQQDKKPSNSAESQVDQSGGKKRDGAPPQDNNAPKIPTNSQEWKNWLDVTLDYVRRAKAVDALNAYWQRNQPIIDEAHPNVQNELNDAFSERLADLAASPSGNTGDGQGNDNRREENDNHEA